MILRRQLCEGKGTNSESQGRQSEFVHGGRTVVGKGGESTSSGLSGASQSSGGKDSSAMANDKSPPFTPNEIMCMMDMYRKNIDVLSSRATTISVNAAKNKAWIQITQAVNAASPGKDRTVVQVRKKWKDLVHRARKDYKKIRNAVDENADQPLPEIGMYSETIWDIYGSRLDLSDDLSSKQSSSSRELENQLSDDEENDFYEYAIEDDGPNSPGSAAAPESEDETDLIPARKKIRTFEESQEVRGEEENSRAVAVRDSLRKRQNFSENEEYAIHDEIRDIRWNLMKAKIAKVELEHKKLVREVEKLDMEKKHLLFKRQKMEMDIVALRKKLNCDNDGNETNTVEDAEPE